MSTGILSVTVVDRFSVKEQVTFVWIHEKHTAAHPHWYNLRCLCRGLVSFLCAGQPPAIGSEIPHLLCSKSASSIPIPSKWLQGSACPPQPNCHVLSLEWKSRFYFWLFGFGKILFDLPLPSHIPLEDVSRKRLVFLLVVEAHQIPLALDFQIKNL